MTDQAEGRKDEATATYSTEEVRKQLGELLARAGYGNERFVIAFHGKPIAALVGLSDYEKLSAA